MALFEIAVVDVLDDEGGYVNDQTLIAAIRSEAAGRYRYLIAKNPKLNKYVNGWLKRAYS